MTKRAGVFTIAPDFQQRDDFGNFEANVQFLKECGVLTSGGRTLEIGSGRGRMLRELRRLGCDVRGVEIDEAMLAEARRLHGELPIERVTGTELPFPEAAFDVVFSLDVFEHIPDSDAHLREVRRVLKPGGRYLLQTPNKWTNTMFETLRWRSFTAWRQDHCSLHSYGGLRRRLESHGFSVTFYKIPVVTDFFRWKVRSHLGSAGVALLAVVNPDRLPHPLRTNFYVQAVTRPEGR